MGWKTYTENIKSGLESFVYDERITQLLKDSIYNNQKIFVAGNGGSSAIASHLECDLSKGAIKNYETNYKRYKVIDLSNRSGLMNAISNDLNYKEVFKQQLINLADKNDISILISSSGNSPNIVEAAKWCKDNGIIVVGMTGFNGGELKKICDYSAHVNFNSYDVCEDIHMMFGHYLTRALKDN
ncbi:MAG TPA: SIS domain-containing protein [Allocoleopsis sp.]